MHISAKSKTGAYIYYKAAVIMTSLKLLASNKDEEWAAEAWWTHLSNS